METASIIKELERELKVRERVYPDWVYHGKLKYSTAEHRKQCIREAIEIIKKYHNEQLQIKF